jgi:hypothetical protein
MTAADYLTYLLRFTRPAEMVPFYPHDSEIEKYARTIGLDNVPPEFRAHLVSEIDLCLLASGFDRKRPSEVKQQLLRLSRSAVRASKDLRRLVERLTDLANAKLPSLLKLHQDLTGDVRPTIIVDRMNEIADQLARLAEIAQKHAGSFHDEGGRGGYFVFETLVLRLAAVYEQATGRKATVTRDPHGSIGGVFPGFIEATLPKVLELSRASGRPFPHPNTKQARGEYIDTTLENARRTRK